MKKELKSKLLKYGSVASALTAGTAVQGQVKYTNIKDTTVTGNNSYYDLDLNQDGIDDFRLATFVDTGATGSTNAILISPFDPLWGNAAGEVQNNFNYPFKLEAGSLINGSTNWNGIGGNFVTGYMAFEVDTITYPNSNWIGPVENGFLGLRIAYDNGIHFGWARLDISADNKAFTVKDFAIEEMADSTVIVGEQLLSQLENMLQTVKISQTSQYIKIDLVDQENAEIRWLNLNGQLLKEAAFENSITLETTSYPAGIYVLQIAKNGIIRNEKISIQ